MSDLVMVVGIGADGWAGLSAAARRELHAAEVLMGSARQLALVPEPTAERVAWPSPMLPALPALFASHRGRRVCVLASGDPMFHGIGTTLVRLLGTDRVRVLPHPSSASLACARLGWAVDRVEVVSVVTRPVESVHAAVHEGRRVLVLSADGRTPARVAALLAARGYGGSTMTVLERLGAAEERVISGTAGGWSLPVAHDLNVVALECRADAGTVPLPCVPGLPDEAFEHDGQLTKREVRAVTLSRLAPVPGELLWDVGAGAGSIAIEWMRGHPANRAVAVESHPERAARISRNAAGLGVPGLNVVTGPAPAALAGLEPPEAVFIGGGVTVPGVVEECWEALRPGGRLVANAVTVESEAVLASWHGELGGDLVRLAVSRAAPVGGFTGWRPMMPVTTWTAIKPMEDER
ncbi:bifunctional cobalt-precorrin-7 (C(5))-methyltransferase/cobalt-precorrin-6B (C(15))-methyltransferase [Streptosporangium roseum]|uniref:Precorrin-6Y C(5,15)-methyltransferase (Decarboxylating) n=1 Tax=Streptosporangium roseum (strain ATCC 12428 / DSM 43021 / JCM 3005 / KCTC 9067 / NCIMB 10171 / NRRL 2505 / NI 9100) TaxID=479432 RepID=D2AR10_STRRD|nr:bifunctional cobalt-precorrin-7 (C(5))-methyltransferase/cobalt-precorrin-6B (C(15))-methyltransferase [Streptosporangium roseum]ACZ88351.1 Precorrin-6Y C(5,15)-methyltransferase (decarboxylating) [Streptosporangium roseum DSM 43021]